MSKRHEIRIGNLVFNIETRDLRNEAGQHIELRNKSSEVLVLLAKHRGDIVGKSHLMDVVWPDVTVTEESLTQCIADIRKAIGDRNQVLLQTHIGKGYSLNPTVGEKRSDARSRAIRIAVGLLVVATIAVSIWMIRATPMSDTPLRIAVLAFDDYSTGDDTDWLSDAISEGLITEFARYREFQVIARNSSFSYRHAPKDVTQIATELDVDYIIEGSQQKSGNTLRVTAQMIDGTDGAHIWAGEYDADIGELFEVQSNIVLSIATQVGYELIWNPPPAYGERRVGALHYYVQGNKAFGEATPGARIVAADLYQKSIDADPDAPFGYAGMATLIWSDVRKRWVFPNIPRDDLLKRGVDYAEKAIALDETYYQAHIARGDLHNAAGEHEDAILRYQIAAQLNPSSSEALAVAADPLLFLDRVDEAIDVLERAIEINPIAPGYYYNSLSRAYWADGRCMEGVQTIKKVRNFRPWDYRALIVNLICLEKFDEAELAGEKLLELDPGFSVSAHGNSIQEVINNPGYLERWLGALSAAGLPM